MHESLLRTIIGCAVVVAALLPSPVIASVGLSQFDSVTVSDKPSCSRCEITFTPLVTLTPALSDSALPNGASLARSSTGLFYAGAQDRVAVFGSDGRFLRAFGRSGDGPGEFRTISSIRIGAGDSLWIFEGNRDYSVFGPDESFVRGGRLPGTSARALPLRSGDLIYASRIPTATAAAYPLHLLDSHASLIKSFAVGAPVLDPRCSQCMGRLVALSSKPDVFWVAWTTRLRLEQWNTAGHREQIIEISAPWFVPRTTDPPDEGRFVVVPPAMAARGLTAAERRELTRDLITDPAPLSLTVNPAGLILLVVHGRVVGAVKQNTIEAIDPDAGLLLASAPWPKGAVGFLNDGLAWGMRETATGLRLLDVWRVELRRPSP